MSKKPPTFEEALARLEAIADDIEQGRIGLEESITRYEEGMRLIQRCRAILTEAEQRIIRLQSESAEPEGPPRMTPPDSSAGPQEIPPLGDNPEGSR
jgi:exodeoxyribonuclease VII small subunit